MDQYQKDLISFQETISKLNDYGVQVTFQKGNSPDDEGNDVCDRAKLNVSDFINDQSYHASVVSDSDKKVECVISQNLPSRSKLIREFTLKPGLNVCLTGEDPIDFFTLTANDEMFRILLLETNKNLSDMREESGGEDTRDSSTAELIRFVGLLLHMGTIQLNRIVDYWSHDPLFSMTCFSSHMNRNRFMILLKCLQHSNLLQHFNEVMNKCYTAGKIITVQEPFYYVDGRLRRKAPNKPENCYALCSVSDSSGVVLKFCVSNKINENVAADLLNDLVCSNRTVYVAQNFSSVRLAHRLLEQSTTCTGLLPNDTLRLANMVQEKPLIGIIQKGALIGRWKKDCTVFFSSEYPEVENADDESIPIAMAQYNKYITNEKSSEELIAYYSCERRQMSLDKKILIHLFQVMLMNAYYLYNEEKETKSQTLYDFRLDVIKSLVEPDLSRWSVDQDCWITHKPCLIGQDSLGRQKRKKCCMCFHVKGIRQDSQYYCPKCPNLPGLCLDSCFKSYHLLNSS